ncbi:MAG: tetratricopeptide repeat protein [Elusimicrobiota bacterium]
MTARPLCVSLCLCGLLALDAGSQGEEPAANSRMNTQAVKQYYQDALDAYARGDYRGAIIKWTVILKEDPEQKSAQSMILEARTKLAQVTKARRQKTADLIAAGLYRKASLEMQVLLDQDPGDPQLEMLRERLQRVIAVYPHLRIKDKAARAAVLGLKGYLSLPPDLKLAHNGLRFACEISPTNEGYKKALALLLKDYPALTREDAVTPGMTLLEYKRFVALHHIYDGKYHLAVGTLNEILVFEPDDLLALKRLGSAYYSLGRKEEARVAWSTALKKAPGDKTLKRFMAKLEKKDDANATKPRTKEKAASTR